MIALEVVARNFLPRCIAFYNRIPIESLKIPNSNAMHRSWFKPITPRGGGLFFFCRVLLLGGGVLPYLSLRDVPLNRVSFYGKDYATGCPFLMKIMRQGIKIDKKIM